MHVPNFSQKGKTDKKLILTKALIRMTEQLHLSRQELSGIIGLSESSLSRLFAKTSYIDPYSKEGELASLLLRLYRNLATFFDSNHKQCQLWLRSGNKDLNGLPIALIQSIEGLILVIQYLDAMRGKKLNGKRSMN